MLEASFVIRPPTWNDLDAVLALIRACEEVDEGEAESTADDLRTGWRLPGVDLSRDAWVVVSPDPSTSLPPGAAQGERVIGYASVWQRVEGLRFESDGYTHPEFRGRGIGMQLLRAVEKRAREQMTLRLGSEPAQGERGAMLRTAVNHANDAARRLLENEGYSPARYYWRMLIGLEASPSSAEWPDGVALRAFEPERDERPVHALIQQAFADNHDYSPLAFEAWRTAMIERDDFDPSLALVATLGAEIVGAALCLRYEGRGWVRTLAVHRDWRRRGIALGLLRSAFAEFYRRGERSVGLVVDSFNRTGAKELYERAGMRVERQHDGYEKEIGAGS